MPMPLGLVLACGTPLELRLNKKMRFGFAGKCSPMDNQNLDYVLVSDVRNDGAFEERFKSSY